jgi:hypothetical protein
MFDGLIAICSALWAGKPKTIALVGNAEPWRDFSAEIDACDRVMRFNQMAYYAQNTGARTDIFMTHSGNPWLMRGETPPCQFEELWISCIEPRCLCDVPWMLFINKWAGKPLTVLLQTGFDFQGMIGQPVASVGFMAIHYVLRHGRLCGGPWLPKLFCFAWQGIPDHAWANEKRVCEELEAAGRLNIVR